MIFLPIVISGLEQHIMILFYDMHITTAAFLKFSEQLTTESCIKRGTEKIPLYENIVIG